MNFLVTGCAGYLGSVLCHQLVSDGHSVVGVDKLLHGGRSIIALLDTGRFRLIPSDISDTKKFADVLDDQCIMIHLAAIVGEPASRRFPEQTRATNVDGSRMLFRLARERAAAKVVFVSTCSNYGVVPHGALATEQTELQPMSIYAESKVQIERELMNGATGSAVWTILRLATLYGLSPRPRFDLTVNDFTKKAIIDRHLEVYLPHSSRPYLHVSDAAAAIRFVTMPNLDTNGEVFNVGTTQENYEKTEIVDMIRRQVGHFVVDYVERGNDPRDYRVNFGKISRTGFASRYTVSDGIGEIANAISENILKDVSSSEFLNA